MDRNTFVQLFPWMTLAVMLMIGTRFAIVEKGNAAVLFFVAGVATFPILWFAQAGAMVAPYIYQR